MLSTYCTYWQYSVSLPSCCKIDANFGINMVENPRIPKTGSVKQNKLLQQLYSYCTLHKCQNSKIGERRKQKVPKK